MGKLKRMMELAQNTFDRYGTTRPAWEFMKRNSQDLSLVAARYAVSHTVPLSLRNSQLVLNEVSGLLFGLAAWAEDGFNVARLSRDLTAALLQTDVSKTFVGMRLPYRTMVLDVSALDASWMSSSDMDGRRVALRFIGLTNFETLNGENAWQVSLFDLDSGIQLWRMVSDEYFFAVSDKTVSVAVKPTAEDELALDLVMRLSASFVVWWTSSTSKPHVTRLKNQKTKTKARKRPVVWIAGKTVRTHSAIIESARAGSKTEQRPLKTQHIVRGHFKKQPCGLARADRKTVWIEPYWRGPDSKVAWTHVYEDCSSPVDGVD